MKRRLPPVLGTLSVLIFVALLGATVYGVVQGQEGATEEPRPPGPHPLDGFGPEDIPLTPFTLQEVEGRNLLEEVTVDCTGATPRVVIRAREPLPAGATIKIKPMSSGVPEPDGITSRWYPVGDPQLLSLSEPASIVETDLSASILAPAEFAKLSVSATFAQPDGSLIQSNIVHVPAAEARCQMNP